MTSIYCKKNIILVTQVIDTYTGSPVARLGTIMVYDHVCTFKSITSTLHSLFILQSVILHQVQVTTNVRLEKLIMCSTELAAHTNIHTLHCFKCVVDKKMMKGADFINIYNSFSTGVSGPATPPVKPVTAFC